MLLVHTPCSPIHFLVRSEKLAKGHTPRFVQDRLFVMAAALPLSYIQFSLDSRIRTCDLLLFILIAVSVFYLVARRLFFALYPFELLPDDPANRARTCNLGISSAFLIAGVGVYFVLMNMGTVGIEPTTYGLRVRCSARLSYVPTFTQS